MRCRNCGQEINPWGKECPWCRTSTQESAYVNVTSWANMALGMMIGGGLAGVVGWNWSQVEDEKLGFSILFALGGAFIGGFVGNVTGWHGADKEMSDRHGRSGGAPSGRCCPNCGYNPGYDARTRPDKFCSNCGKRFGG